MKTHTMHRQGALLIIAALLGALGFWTYTQAAGGEIKACVNTSGAVYVIGNGFKKTVCAKGEQLLSWNQQGIQGEKGDKGDTGPAGPSYHLYDANNQDLGIVINSPDGQNVTTFQTLISSLGVFVNFNDFTPQGGPSEVYMSAGFRAGFYFTAFDCTGDRFLNTSQPLGVLRDGRGAHVVVTNDPPTSRSRLSVLDSIGGCQNVLPDNQSHTYLYSEVTLPFSEPILKPLHVGLP